jgi:hypothetical protein
MNENYIKTHEEMAETFAILGPFSLITLWANWKTKVYAKVLSYVVLLFALITIFYAQKTGTTGGEIRHTEIRNNGSIDNTVIDQNVDQEDDEDD